jgi:hypothetical protein
MATRKPKPPVNAEYAAKEPSEVHNAFSTFITTTTGVEVDARTVGLVQRLYPLFLKSPEVAEARNAAKAERESQRSQREAVKKAKLQRRLDKIEEERQRVLKSLGVTDAPAALSLVGEEVDPEVDAEDGEEPEAEEVTLPEPEEVTEDDEWDDDEPSGDEDEEEF